jgi:hypothetical protein
MKQIARVLLLLVTGSLAARGVEASSIQLITNGGFETGTLAGWVPNTTNASCGTFIAATGTNVAAGYTSVGAETGTYYALSSITCGITAQALIQSFTVPIDTIHLTLSFDMFVNNWSNLQAGTNLDDSINPNEHAQVDILGAAATPFSSGNNLLVTGASNTGAICGPNLACAPVHDYTHYVFDITALASPGGTYQLRFGDIASTWYLQTGVDNVSILADTTAVPEPASLLLLGSGLAMVLKRSRLRRRSPL